VSTSEASSFSGPTLGAMTQPEEPANPSPEREDRRDEDYAAVMDRLGLQEPQGPSEAFPEGIGHEDLAVARRQWPYDY